MTTIDDGVHADTTEEFAERIVGSYRQCQPGHLCCRIGHQTGLFDTLADFPPATSAQIADAAGLNERYVREWLGGVVTARRSWTTTRRHRRIRCRAHRAAALTRAAGPDNLARVAQFIPLLG